ncbi:MAG TPA: hypothetical protein VNX18_05755 [Bryobacteraceae bacterium]|jgi:hypothetical protein|nr:hypothetical protein [Bryobacteraceae bacterium]
MIEHLIDKPTDQSVDEWLKDVSRSTVLVPVATEEWVSLSGIRALKVRNGDRKSNESENIYVLNGSKTFAIRASDLNNAAFLRLYQQVIRTFRFTGR